MKWNWQRADWPNFRYDSKALESYEKQFLYESGILEGIKKYLSKENADLNAMEILVEEAMNTSAIEGEYLDRESVQSSICKALGLKTTSKKAPPKEHGVATLMLMAYLNHGKPISHDNLSFFAGMLVGNSRSSYRTSEEPMQVISYGKWHEPIVHFEAPPHQVVYDEMDKFIKWFNNEPPSLAKSGLAHLYFISIHPFEDGNGRVARALAHMSLPGAPFIALSNLIYKRRKIYYDMLEKNNKDLEVTSWLSYFAKEILEAQKYTQGLVDFTINKTKFYDLTKGWLNERQGRAIDRIFKEGFDGFKGGLSAENYITITGTTRSTATRDLQDLVDKGLMTKSGALKSTRYTLKAGL